MGSGGRLPVSARALKGADCLVEAWVVGGPLGTRVRLPPQAILEVGWEKVGGPGGRIEVSITFWVKEAL